MIETTGVAPATGNVFLDLGFGPDKAANLKVRATLMLVLRRYIRAREMTQQQAAELMGVNQPEISNLVNGKIDLFSVDKLINMLSRVGYQVGVSVRPRAEAA